MRVNNWIPSQIICSKMSLSKPSHRNIHLFMQEKSLFFKLIKGMPLCHTCVIIERSNPQMCKKLVIAMGKNNKSDNSMWGMKWNSQIYKCISIIHIWIDLCELLMISISAQQTHQKVKVIWMDNSSMYYHGDLHHSYQNQSLWKLASFFIVGE